MKLRTIIILAIAAMVATIILLLILKFIPIGTRSAQQDIKVSDTLYMLDDEVINLSRPHYIIPREFIYTSGFHPFRFWHYNGDAHFSANKISSHFFMGLNTLGQLANVQGFNINLNYSEPTHREQVMAVRWAGKIYDYPTPGFQYSHGLSHLGRFFYIGQEGVDLYYYYPYAKHDPAFNREHFRHVEAILKISLPLKSGEVEIVKSDDLEQWPISVKKLQSLTLSTFAFTDLCQHRSGEARKFANMVFQRSCP